LVPVASAAPPSESDVLEKALPGVVLLVNQRVDGKVGFGSGILLDGEGRVLTNMHVIADAASLGAMLYDAKRTSYIPADGGLARYLFENERDVHPALLQRGDPALDLAVVKIGVDTTKYARLPFRDDAVRIGERVLALGHPNETVWSFSAGLVSSLHSAIIQTDAAINHGNSGGPLIDTRGRIVGVNTSKLFGDSQGISFARPIALARELVAGVAAPFEPDLSSPERGVATCARAWELASSAVADCFDDESRYTLMMEAWQIAAKKLALPPKQLDALKERTEKYGKEQWITFQRNIVIAAAKGQSIDAVIESMQKSIGAIGGGSMSANQLNAALRANVAREDVTARVRRAMSDVAAYEASWDKRLLERTGLKLDSQNPNAMRDVRKMGLRVERVVKVGDDRAWVAIEGRNLDNTKYEYAELWLRRGSVWRERTTPVADDVKVLPSGFPTPFGDYQTDLAIMVDYMLASMKSAKKAGVTSPKSTDKLPQ
jgi:hypothetical protein